MNSYTLRINKLQIFFTYLVPILFFLTVIVSFINLWVEKSTPTSLVVLFIIWPFIIINWKKYLNKPVTITVTHDEVIFMDMFKNETIVPLSDFRIIDVRKTKEMKIATLEGEILGIQAFNDFSRFVQDVKKHNTALETKGC